ncbi:signal peptidase I SipW [Ammoniphilus sp. CFH 90114]|uniref:signal peptidase I SipW n=1 Tax=Ammoniphilus sp. CFH 90114 TaxID=2493665 RepID=UPI00100ECBDF|nr:signal peptidase I [Ammoniphilus sp. CFH 90114]RXT04388.1 signal peptidase I [Ammoniphilus sp. CFH 90114]
MKELILKKIISRIISILLIAALILTTYVTFQSRVTGGQPNIFGYRLMNVLSGSMEPAIHTGSIILVKPIVNNDQLKVGDIITYKSNIKEGILVTHRIVDVTDEREIEYVTKGDANESKDPRPIPSELVVGKYSNIMIPFVGYILSFIQSKKGLALLVIIPGLVIVFTQLFQLVRVFRESHVKEKDISSSVGDRPS